MNTIRDALTESWGHGIFTAELALGVVFGVTFIVLYARRQWWASRAGRLTMGNMVALTLLSAGGFLFRLGWQAEALTVLIPTCALVLLVMFAWVGQLVSALRDAPPPPAVLVEQWQEESWALNAEGRSGEAQQAHRHAQELAAALGIEPVDEPQSRD